MLSSCAATQTSANLNPSHTHMNSKPNPSQFNGTWVGELLSLNGVQIDQEEIYAGTRKFKIEILDGRGLIYQWKSNKWQRFWQDKYTDYFLVYPNDTNAVVYQTKSGRDANCLWVETWTFNITKTDTHTANAYFNRTVNNRECKIEDDGIWNKSGSLILKRID